MSAALVNTLNGVADLSGVTLDRGKSVSVFAIGLVNGGGGQAPVMKAYVDDRTPITGQAKVRVIHLAPDSPPVDLVTLNGGVIAQRLVTNLAYADATATPLTLAPGDYTLAVVPTGASTPLLPAGGSADNFCGRGRADGRGCRHTGTQCHEPGRPTAQSDRSRRPLSITGLVVAETAPYGAVSFPQSEKRGGPVASYFRARCSASISSMTRSILRISA